MSSRFCASIRIGGKIKRSKVEPLLKEIRAAALSLEWGDAPFTPQNADELLQACGGSWLSVCDEQANYGEFPELEPACRKLGLSYCRHGEASFDCDAELADWRPGMKKALVRAGSNINSHDSYVPTAELLTSLTREMTGFGPTAHTRSSENAEILGLAVFSVGANFRHLFLHLKDDRNRTKTPSFMHSHEGRSGCLES